MRIISYSLFESATSPYAREKGRSILQFTQFLKLIVRSHHVLWGGWEMWLHHDTAAMNEPYFPTLQRLHADGLLKLINCGKAEHLCESMLWRMKPAFETDAEAVVCRDLDIIPGPLDRMAVGEWLQSGRAVHVIHFAGAHSGIMGGTTSVRPKRFRELLICTSLEEFIARGRRDGLTFDIHGDDQLLLNANHRVLCSDMLVHELHHDVGDLPAIETRRKIAGAGDSTFPVEADKFSPGIGMCEDPTNATAYYDSLDLQVIHKIRACEA